MLGAALLQEKNQFQLCVIYVAKANRRRTCEVCFTFSNAVLSAAYRLARSRCERRAEFLEILPRKCHGPLRPTRVFMICMMTRCGAVSALVMHSGFARKCESWL